MTGLELFYIGLLIASTLAIGWVACVVLYRLYKGQR